MVAIPDIAVLALCALALAFLLTVKEFATALYKILNIGIAGVHPFANIAVAIENSLIKWANDAINGTEKVMARFWNELAASLTTGIEGMLKIGDGVVTGIGYLWNHALPAFVKLQTDLIRSVANEAKTLSNALVGSIASNLRAAEHYAESQAASALRDAQAYALSHVDGAISTLRRELGADVATLQEGLSRAQTAMLQTVQNGLTAAERFAQSEAGAALRTAEGEIALAEQIAAQGLATAEQIAAAGVAGAERAAGSALAQSEAAAKQALAQSEAIGAAALAGVRGIAVGAADDLKTVEGALSAAGVAGLIASIPAIATLVHTIATEAGLDSAECRAKNKAICGTSPGSWLKLLEGAALLGITFNLRELVQVAKTVIADGESVIKQFG